MDMDRQFVQLAKLALGGRQGEVSGLVRRTLLSLLKRRPDLTVPIQEVVALAAGNPARTVASLPLPVDVDSRLALLRKELITDFSPEPVWSPILGKMLQSVLAEREKEHDLFSAGLAPTRSLLFVGQPGVGKTIAARWLAFRLGRPLLTLDLATVMSSFLGKTGNNIRVVLEYARRSPTVLLLDEFDAIAKRRDDTTEVGELKRLVTVLLQAIDDWPSDGLLIAASNHPDLLDHAVWRRFDQTLVFPMPTFYEIRETISRLVTEVISDDARNLLAASLAGSSFAEVTRVVYGARRNEIMTGITLERSVLGTVSDLCADADKKRKLQIARALDSCNRGQREISSLTGLSRDTLRKNKIGILKRKAG